MASVILFIWDAKILKGY